MGTAYAERTVFPPRQGELLGRLVEVLDALPAASGPARLIGPDGAEIELPGPVYEVLRDVAHAMSRGQAVTVAPHNTMLTTQEAAHLLGTSRPTLVKLLEDGEIPYTRPSRHRRVMLADLLAYQQRRRHERQRALAEMVEIGEEAGIYERAAEPRSIR